MDITTIKYPSHNELVQWYYQLAQRIADTPGVTPEQVNELIDAYIAEHPYPVVPDDIITQSNAATNVVTSVNGEKGDVTIISGGDVPDNVLTTDNIAQNAVTSVNGKTGDVSILESPPNVITTDNLGALAVLSFNGQNGVVNYTPPVTSVNGMTGDVFTPIHRPSNIGGWAFGIRTSNAIALIFAYLLFTFDGIDISYNATIPEDLHIAPVALFSWVPAGQTFSSVSGYIVSQENRTIKILIEDHGSGVVTPPTSVWAGCVLYGGF